MNQYVTGAVIKSLREKHHLTQAELAKKLSVSDKTISKWETAKEKREASRSLRPRCVLAKCFCTIQLIRWY